MENELKNAVVSMYAAMAKTRSAVAEQLKNNSKHPNAFMEEFEVFAHQDELEFLGCLDCCTIEALPKLVEILVKRVAELDKLRRTVQAMHN
jgi:hypothetical protein